LRPYYSNYYGNIVGILDHQKINTIIIFVKGNTTEIKGVNIYGSSQALQTVLAAIGQL
jgi:hypothetical protein